MLVVLVLYHDAAGDLGGFGEYASFLRNLDMSALPALQETEEALESLLAGEGAGTAAFVRTAVAGKRAAAAAFSEKYTAALLATLPSVFNANLLTLERIRWAHEVVTSRAFRLPESAAGRGFSLVLAPVADLMNFPSPRAWAEESGDCIACDIVASDSTEGAGPALSFQCLTSCDIEEGEAVVYNRLGNNRCKGFMLSNYGFYSELNGDVCEDGEGGGEGSHYNNLSGEEKEERIYGGSGEL